MKQRRRDEMEIILVTPYMEPFGLLLYVLTIDFWFDQDIPLPIELPTGLTQAVISLH
jgi:hypothetical protein